MVKDASATKAPIAKIADKVSGVFVPVVMTISLITLIVWLLIGQTFPYALARAISVLVISCPCALGLATPVAIMVGNGLGAKTVFSLKLPFPWKKPARSKSLPWIKPAPSPKENRRSPISARLTVFPKKSFYRPLSLWSRKVSILWQKPSVITAQSMLSKRTMFPISPLSPATA